MALRRWKQGGQGGRQSTHHAQEDLGVGELEEGGGPAGGVPAVPGGTDVAGQAWAMSGQAAAVLAGSPELLLHPARLPSLPQRPHMVVNSWRPPL